jgi:hypothetical protein
VSGLKKNAEMLPNSVKMNTFATKRYQHIKKHDEKDDETEGYE